MQQTESYTGFDVAQIQIDAARSIQSLREEARELGINPIPRRKIDITTALRRFSASERCSASNRIWARRHEPMCARSMGCLCACHAAGLDASEPCNTSEDRAREIAIEYDCA